MPINGSTINNAEKLLAGLAADGATIPAAVTDAQARLAATNTAAIDNPDPAAITGELAARIAAGDKPTAAEWAAAAQANYRRDVHARAIEIAKNNVARAVNDHADQLLDAARTTWFDPAVARLTDIANRVDVDDTAESLLRAGRGKDAADLATADAELAKIRRATQARNVLFGSVVGNASAQFVNADEVKVRPTDDVRGWITAIGAGAIAWLPTPEQAADRQATKQRDLAQRVEEATQAIGSSRPRRKVTVV